MSTEVRSLNKINTMIDGGEIGGGLPSEAGNKGKSLTNNGVVGDGFWSPVTTNPNTLTADYTIATGTSATVASGFTIADGVTLTIPDGSVLGVV